VRVWRKLIKAKNPAVVVGGFPAQMLRQVMKTKPDGVTGYNFLKEFKVTIDYANEILYSD
jgi:hypothetical protein